MKANSFKFNALVITVGRGLTRVYDVKDISKDSGALDDLQTRIAHRLEQTNIESLGSEEKVHVMVQTTGYFTPLDIPLPLPLAGYQGTAGTLDEVPESHRDSIHNRAEAAALIAVEAVINMLEATVEINE